MGEEEDTEFGPLGHRINQQTGTYRRGTEPAIRETVDAQIESVRQRAQDLVNLLKAELSGQIEVLRKEVGDLRDTRRKAQERRWDLQKLAVQGLFYLLAAGVGALIMSLVTSGRI